MAYPDPSIERLAKILPGTKTALWKVERVDAYSDKHEVYDANHSVTVLADDELGARQHASRVCRDEGPGIWHDHTLVSATRLGDVTVTAAQLPVVSIDGRDG